MHKARRNPMAVVVPGFGGLSCANVRTARP